MGTTLLNNNLIYYIDETERTTDNKVFYQLNEKTMSVMEEFKKLNTIKDDIQKNNRSNESLKEILSLIMDVRKFEVINDKIISSDGYKAFIKDSRKSILSESILNEIKKIALELNVIKLEYFEKDQFPNVWMKIEKASTRNSYRCIRKLSDYLESYDIYGTYFYVYDCDDDIYENVSIHNNYKMVI